MSKKHEITEDGERYLSHIAIKKQFGISKKKLNEWVKSSKIRSITREVARMPHKLINDPQLEWHYFCVDDVKKAIQEDKQED